MRRRIVTLVARREVLQRLRDRTLVVSTVVTVLLLGAIVVLPAALGDGDDGPARVAAGAGPDLVTARTAASLEPGVDVVTTDDPLGAVRDGRADAAVSGGRIVFPEEPGEELLATLQEGARLARLDERARDAFLSGAPLAVQRLDGEADDVAAEQREGIAFVAVILLYAQLIGYGFWIASGVVEEKSSRVVEVLLATISPRELLAGKVLGIGAVALAQLLLIGMIGVALSLAVDALDVPGDAIGALALVLAFFLLGYGFYAALFAVAGALVPRQEEVQNTTAPLTLLLLASFFVSFTALQDPDGGLAVAASLAPPSAPMVLPVRIIAGEAAVWEVVLGVALLVGAAALLVAVAARVYEGAVLQTRTRIRLRDALAATRG